MEKRNKEMPASGVEVEHTKLDDLLLDIHKRQMKAKVEAAEAWEANNKNLDKEKQEAKETRRLSMKRLSKTKSRRSNSDDDFDVFSSKQKKSKSSRTDNMAYLREKTEKDFHSDAPKKNVLESAQDLKFSTL